MKGKRTIILIIFVLLLAGIKIFYLNGDKKNGQGKQKPASAAVQVYISIAKSAQLEHELNITGSVLANEEATLRPETSGKIMQLNIQEGSAVEKGELLAKLDDANLRAQRNKAVAVLELAKQKEARLKILLAAKGVSEDEYDVAVSTLHSAAADLQSLDSQIDDTEVRAPFKGMVGLRNFSEGNYITPADIIANIQQIDRVKIDFNVPERYAGKIKLNDTVKFSLEGENKSFSAKIFAFDQKIDAATRTLKIRAICDNSKHEIYPGTFVKVTCILRVARSVMVPLTCVIPDLHGQKIFVVRNGKADVAYIEGGSRNDSTLEVISGVSPGDTVVTAGMMALKKGSAVKVMKRNIQE